MRAEPNANSGRITQIPYGTELEIEKVNDEWAKTSYNNKEGYVIFKYLSTKDEITKASLQRIYDKLSDTLNTIKEVL